MSDTLHGRPYHPAHVCTLVGTPGVPARAAGIRRDPGDLPGMGHDERLHGVLLAAGARLITLGEIGARPRRTAGPSTLA